MYETFENLPMEKKQRIIDAGVEEFARNGYEQASTNNIIKTAGISKGLLFHYFGNKKNYFLYLTDHIINLILKKFYEEYTNPPGDIFDRLIHRSLIKLKISYDEPLLYEFLFKNYLSCPEDLKLDMQKIFNKLYADGLAKFYEGLDYTQFREGIDHKKALELILMLLEGLNNKYIAVYKGKKAQDVLLDYNKLIAEYHVYFDLLKKGIYK